MKLKPLFDRVVLKNIKTENTRKSGIFIPQTVGDEPLLAEVVAVGDGETFEGNTCEMQVKVKDKVLYNKYGSVTFKLDEEEYVILRQSDILGVFKEKDNG